MGSFCAASFWKISRSSPMRAAAISRCCAVRQRGTAPSRTRRTHQARKPLQRVVRRLQAQLQLAERVQHLAPSGHVRFSEEMTELGEKGIHDRRRVAKRWAWKATAIVAFMLRLLEVRIHTGMVSGCRVSSWLPHEHVSIVSIVSIAERGPHYLRHSGFPLQPRTQLHNTLHTAHLASCASFNRDGTAWLRGGEGVKKLGVELLTGGTSVLPGCLNKFASHGPNS
jgi:hypothetical protein